MLHKNSRFSVHFKIHVPEIIKHHIHTKTVFIHVYEIKPDEHEKGHDEEGHYEDYTSFNTYNYQNSVEENGSKYRQHSGYGLAPPNDYMPLSQGDYQPGYGSLINDHYDNQLGVFGSHADLEGLDPRIKAYQPPPPPPPPPDHYETHENVEEEPRGNDIDYVHKEGYRRGGHTESGRVLHKDLDNFYDRAKEEEDYERGRYEHDSHESHGSHGNYDKEIGAEQRAAKKKLNKWADSRWIVAKMVIR